MVVCRFSASISRWMDDVADEQLWVGLLTHSLELFLRKNGGVKVYMLVDVTQMNLILFLLHKRNKWVLTRLFQYSLWGYVTSRYILFLCTSLELHLIVWGCNKIYNCTFPLSLSVHFKNCLESMLIKILTEIPCSKAHLLYNFIRVKHSVPRLLTVS